MTKNGQNMAKMEKIRNIQMTDNKEDKFFYFPMISMPCTGSGYKMVELSPCKSVTYEGCLFIYCNITETFSIFHFKTFKVKCK